MTEQERDDEQPCPKCGYPGRFCRCVKGSGGDLVPKEAVLALVADLHYRAQGSGVPSVTWLSEAMTQIRALPAVDPRSDLEALRDEFATPAALTPAGQGEEADMFWPSDDPEQPYDEPVEFADATGEHSIVFSMDRAKRLSSRWYAARWDGPDDEGNWVITDHDTEEAALAALNREGDSEG